MRMSGKLGNARSLSNVFCSIQRGTGMQYGRESSMNCLIVCAMAGKRWVFFAFKISITYEYVEFFGTLRAHSAANWGILGHYEFFESMICEVNSLSCFKSQIVPNLFLKIRFEGPCFGPEYKRPSYKLSRNNWIIFKCCLYIIILEDGNPVKTTTSIFFPPFST